MKNKPAPSFNIFEDPDIASSWWDRSGPFSTLHDINLLRFQWLCSYVELKDLQVLDLGCGGGILSESLAKSHAQVTAIDSSQVAIEAAKKHAQENSLSINYLCQSSAELKKKYSTYFDVITCFEMLEHIDEIDAIIRDCSELLKPGGLVFFSTLNRTIKSYLLAILGAEYVLNLIPPGTHEWSQFIKPSELILAAQKYQLEPRYITGMSYNPITRSIKFSPSTTVNYSISFQKT